MALKDKRRRVTTITVWERDQEYLDTIIARIKRTRRETNKSELIGLAIEFLRQKSPAQFERLLRGRNPAS